MKPHRFTSLVLVAGVTLLAVAGCGKSAAPTAANSPIDQAPPAAPTNVHGTYVAATCQDHLAWDASTSANTASYQLEVFSSAPGPSDVGTPAGNCTGTDMVLAPVGSDCTEYYRVRAVDASGNPGAYSQTATVVRHNADQGNIGGSGGGGSSNGNGRRIPD